MNTDKQTWQEKLEEDLISLESLPSPTILTTIINWIARNKELIGQEEREKIVNECRDTLLKQTFLMSHENGYPSYAVPKANILELPALMKVKSQSQEGKLKERL